MTATLAQTREALAAPCRTLSGLHVYPYWVSLPTLPALLIKPSARATLETLTGHGPNETVFELVLVTATQQTGEEAGQKLLDPYLEEDGERSIEKLLYGPDVSLADGVQVIEFSWGNYGALDLSGVVHIGVVFTLRVWR